jgi:hypothetical protein
MKYTRAALYAMVILGMFAVATLIIGLLVATPSTSC